MPSRKRQLELARCHVKQAQLRVEEQADLVTQLREDGYETATAERLLAVYLEVMHHLSLHRDVMEREAGITASRQSEGYQETKGAPVGLHPRAPNIPSPRISSTLFEGRGDRRLTNSKVK